MVETSERADHIADIRAYAELGHPPNVDRDLHRWHLTTEVPEQPRGIMPSPRRAPWLCDRHREEMLRIDPALACGLCSTRLRRHDEEELRRPSVQPGASPFLSSLVWSRP